MERCNAVEATGGTDGSEWTVFIRRESPHRRNEKGGSFPNVV
jgi:hypothetical protein